jgi:hypothetical protein
VTTKGQIAVFAGAKIGDAQNDAELRSYTLKP